MTKSLVEIIGPDPVRSQGGMATVIANMLGSDFLRERYRLEMYPSFIDGPLLKRATYSTIRQMCFRKPADVDIFHIHICSGTSTWRKRRYVQNLGDAAGGVVLHVHGARYHTFFDSCNEREKGEIRRLYDSVGSVIVLSEEWRDVFCDRQICDPSKIEVIHNAVPIPKKNCTQYGSRRVLFMGRLAERKSPDVLLRAAVKILKEFPDAHFTFAGDGDVERYKALARELGIDGSCTFAGWVSGEGREKLFRESDIYCLPSKNEGMPMSVLEAMSYGLPVITTPVGGIPQVIRSDVNGILMPVGDADALAEELLKLMASPARSKEIGEMGRRTIEERFGMDAFSECISAVYERLLQ